MDDILNLEELTLEQMQGIYDCFANNKDPEKAESALMDYLEKEINNPKIWKR